MAFLKHATTIAVLASAGVMGVAASASAAADSAWNGGSEHHEVGDNGVGQGGVIPVNALNAVNVSPNLGCVLDRPLDDVNVQSLIGLVPIGAGLNHVLEHPTLNLLANGNTTTNTYDYSCTSNQGSSQAGNNSHGSAGAGDSNSSHSVGDGSGSQNAGAGAGAGGLLGATGVLGKGGLDLY